MASPRGGSKGITDEQFIETWRRLRSPTLVAGELGISKEATHSRRRSLESRHGIILATDDTRKAYATADIDNSRAVYKLRIPDGQVLIGSDAHVWPGALTTVQRAFIAFAKKLKPAAIIMNGDVFDGATVSRHPSIGWETKPTVKQELEAVGDFLGELEKVSGASKRIWTAGNHDLRLESRIAAQLPELAGIKGVHLKDWFDRWTPCWRVDINEDVVVKHRMNGGEHSDWQNVLKSGKTTVTGHDHRIGVTPYRDYRGLRWGVRTGYMAESALDEQFVHYMEAAEPNWNPGFALLTFVGGRLLWPEIATKFDDEHIEFRGEVIRV